MEGSDLGRKTVTLWSQLEFTVGITGHQDFPLLRKVSVDSHESEWLKLSSSPAAHKANKIPGRKASLLIYLCSSAGIPEFLTALPKIFTRRARGVECLLYSKEVMETSWKFSNAMWGHQQNMHLLSCSVARSDVWEWKVFPVCWLMWNNLEAFMQYLLVEYQFCQEKKVLGVDILISVFVKGTKDWVDLKTDLPLQQLKRPLQGRGALRGEGRGWEAHGVCSVTRQGAHPHQWACYCEIWICHGSLPDPLALFCWKPLLPTTTKYVKHF